MNKSKRWLTLNLGSRRLPNLMSERVETAGGTFSRPAVWWGLSAASLLLGYADLWRGGDTIAPILLVVGYCILVPIAILK